MANAAASLSGFDTILNNNKSSNIYFSASALTFLIAILLLAKFSSNSKSTLGLTSVLVSILSDHKFSVGLGGGLEIRSG